MMRFEKSPDSLVDTRTIQLDHVEPGFSILLRNADALLLVVDLAEDPFFRWKILLEVLKEMRIRAVGRVRLPLRGRVGLSQGDPSRKQK